jgi:two-component system, cell cycle response regulator
MIPSRSIAVPSRRVLLIESSAPDRQLLRTWLASDRIETWEARDIITALAACQTYHPSLILLQLRLPTWDGYEVIRRLKNDPKTRTTPVIFLASSALTVEKAKGIDLGAVDFVSKPFDSVELLARVNSALRTKALVDLLDQRAHLDGLTELGNRHALQDGLPQYVADCRDARRPLSVMIADLDHFKRVNDEFGHAAGDEVLRRAAAVLRGSVRGDDFLARYGGEEFVAVCPDCAPFAALATAERIREVLAGQKIMFRNAPIQITVSVGVAHSDPEGEPIHASELLERADQALYKAKAAGRNAVWYWDSQWKKPLPASPDPGVSRVAGAGPPPPSASPSGFRSFRATDMLQAIKPSGS